MESQAVTDFSEEDVRRQGAWGLISGRAVADGGGAVWQTLDGSCCWAEVFSDWI